MKSGGFGKYIVNALMAATAGRVTGILRSELEDAKEEMRTKAKGLGIGAALVGVAMTFLFFATGILLAAAVIGLSQVWPAWLAALVIGGAILVIAAILIAIGAATINKNKDLRPERAIAHLSKFFAR